MYQILHGDAFTKLKEFPDNYFDSCILDGPYGLGFMGKEWDTFKPEYINQKLERDSRGNRIAAERASTAAGTYDLSASSNLKFQLWFESLAKEVYRVLKPGAYFLSFGGTRTYHRMICGIEDAGFEIRDCMQWIFGSGFPKSYNLTDELGSALKPAWEPICMARKPLDGTIEQNYKKWGTGVLNIAKTRVQGEPWTFGTQTDMKGGNYGTNRPSDGKVFAKNVTGGESGRWPANLLHDGSEEVTSLFPVTKSGFMKQKIEGGQFNVYAKQYPREVETIGDEGNAARFFYCAKTSRSDRNEGLELMSKSPLLWSSGTKNPGTFQSSGTDKSSQNNHPTVKPTKLMRYLAVLVTPPGGHVSCAHATKVREKLNRAGKQLSL